MPTHDDNAAEPVRVGLVGAGPWATMVHAPMLAAGPETRLVGVWARRPEAAAELADRNRAKAFAHLEDLYEVVDAVAFSVPPAVQAELAVGAAAAGKALLLEKPIAGDVAGAETLVAAIDQAAVPSLVALTWRYSTPVRQFLEEAAQETFFAGSGVFLSDALITGRFRTPWRLERGPLLDLGPHVVDLLASALGPVLGVRASGDLRRWVSLLLEHKDGATSQVSLSGSLADHPFRASVEVFGETRSLSVDCASATTVETFATLRAELAATASTGEPHSLDAHHGLELQRILAAAEAELQK